MPIVKPPKHPSASKPRKSVPKVLAKPRVSKTKPKPAKTTKPKKRDKSKAVAMAAAVRSVIEKVNTGQVGCPTDYLPEYALLAEKLCLLNVGITDKDLAQFFNVCEATITNWKREQPEFLASIRNGKDLSDPNVAHALYRRAIGAEYVEEEVVKRKVVEYDPKTFKKIREEEFIEVVPVVKTAPPDAAAGRYWMNNRRRHQTAERQWVDRAEVTHQGGDKPIQTEEVGMGFARRVAFMLERSTRLAAQQALTVVSGVEDELEPVAK